MLNDSHPANIAKRRWPGAMGHNPAPQGGNAFPHGTVFLRKDCSRPTVVYRVR